jgi:hypothetical protein
MNATDSDTATLRRRINNHFDSGIAVLRAAGFATRELRRVVINTVRYLHPSDNRYPSSGTLQLTDGKVGFVASWTETFAVRYLGYLDQVIRFLTAHIDGASLTLEQRLAAHAPAVTGFDANVVADAAHTLLNTDAAQQARHVDIDELSVFCAAAHVLADAKERRASRYTAVTAAKGLDSRTDAALAVLDARISWAHTARYGNLDDADQNTRRHHPYVVENPWVLRTVREDFHHHLDGSNELHYGVRWHTDLAPTWSPKLFHHNSNAHLVHSYLAQHAVRTVDSIRIDRQPAPVIQYAQRSLQLSVDTRFRRTYLAVGPDNVDHTDDQLRTFVRLADDDPRHDIELDTIYDVARRL